MNNSALRRGRQVTQVRDGGHTVVQCQGPSATLMRAWAILRLDYSFYNSHRKYLPEIFTSLPRVVW